MFLGGWEPFGSTVFFLWRYFQVNSTGVAGMTDLDVMHRCGVLFFVLNTRLRRVLVGGQCIQALSNCRVGKLLIL